MQEANRSHLDLLARPGCSRPDPAYIPLAAARPFHLPFATSCPAQRGKADVQFGLPADAASLRETGSVDRYTPHTGNHCKRS